jgi:serine/threonine protein kinase
MNGLPLAALRAIEYAIQIVSGLAAGHERGIAHRNIKPDNLFAERNHTLPVPGDAYDMSGAGGQTTLIIPSHDLVAVRLGHYQGSGSGGRALRVALALVIKAVPQSR